MSQTSAINQELLRQINDSVGYKIKTKVDTLLSQNGGDSSNISAIRTTQLTDSANVSYIRANIDTNTANISLLASLVHTYKYGRSSFRCRSCCELNLHALCC